LKGGRVWKYGDDINTDVIFPGKYTYSVLEPEEMARHALEDLDPDFAGEVQPGDFIVAGKNFGCGSSREQAATCLKFAGIQAVIAKSFARIFFRNAINQGLPVIQCAEAVDHIEHGDEIAVHYTAGTIETEAGVFDFASLPESIMNVLEAGGLIPYIKRKIKGQKNSRKSSE
jgi:3-isopropylmalate/(R)-2-methylmalate dehydratase small subunit